MKEITESTITGFIRHGNLWTGAKPIRKTDWKGSQNGKRVERKAHQGTDSQTRK